MKRFLLPLLTLTPLVAAAATPYTYRIVGSGNRTERTGWAGNAHDDITLSAKVGLRKITFSEKHNKPIWVRAEGVPVSNEGGDG